MGPSDIEHLEYSVASSFRELVELTSLEYALRIANAFVQAKGIQRTIIQLEDKRNGHSDKEPLTML